MKDREAKKLRYGLIGAGCMGQEHIRNLSLVPGNIVTALADPNASSIAAAKELVPGTPNVYSSHLDLLASEDVDALIIATPNDTHAGILKDIFVSGKVIPILVEKPLCTTAADCDDLETAAAAYPAPIWVAMEYRYMPPVEALLKSVRSGELGTLRMLSLTEHRGPFLDKVDAWNRYASRSGGTLVEKACHFFDLMRLILGDDPVRVYASAGNDVNHKDERYGKHIPDIIDNAFVIVDFRGGARAMLDLCMFAEGTEYEEQISVIGDKAKAESLVPRGISHESGREDVPPKTVLSSRATLQPVMREIEVDPVLLAAGHHHGSTYYEHLGFRRVVLGDGDVAVTVADGLWAVRMGLAAEQSAKEVRAVSLDFSH